MPLDVYDYRTDVRNVAITPEIRSRFLRMEPGYVAPNLDGEDLDIYDLPNNRIPAAVVASGNGEADKMRLRPTGTAH